MTRLTADDRCPACGGLLVPPEAAFIHKAPPNTDYVCLQCGRPYRWVRTSLQLHTPAADSPSDEDPREAREHQVAAETRTRPEPLACPVCHEQAIDIVLDVPTFQVCRCRRCGARFTLKPPITERPESGS